MAEQNKPLYEQIDVIQTIEKFCAKLNGGSCEDCKWTCAIDTRRDK